EALVEGDLVSRGVGEEEVKLTGLGERLLEQEQVVGGRLREDARVGGGIGELEAELGNLAVGVGMVVLEYRVLLGEEAVLPVAPERVVEETRRLLVANPNMHDQPGEGHRGLALDKESDAGRLIDGTGEDSQLGLVVGEAAGANVLPGASG